MSLPVIVLGAGGHAKVLVEALLRASAVISGIVDPDPALSGTQVLGVPVLGGDDIVAGFSPAEIQLVNGLGSIGLTTKRQKVFERFKELGYTFATVVHPSAIIASDVVLSEGAQIMAGAVIQPCCLVGVNSIINTHASVDHDCVVGAHVHVAPGVTLSGGVTVGKNSHIGTGATVIQQISIGSHSLVAAGAVVTHDVKDNSVVKGIPAKESVQ